MLATSNLRKISRSRPSFLAPFITDLAREAAALPGVLASAFPAILADYLGCVFPDGDCAAVVPAR